MRKKNKDSNLLKDSTNIQELEDSLIKERDSLSECGRLLAETEVWWNDLVTPLLEEHRKLKHSKYDFDNEGRLGFIEELLQKWQLKADWELREKAKLEKRVKKFEQDLDAYEQNKKDILINQLSKKLGYKSAPDSTED